MSSSDLFSAPPIQPTPAHFVSHSSNPSDQLSVGAEQPVQALSEILTFRVARLRSNDHVIHSATVDKELLECPGIANLLRRFALANGFNLDICSNGCWRIPSLTDPASVISITVAGCFSEIVVVAFF